MSIKNFDHRKLKARVQERGVMYKWLGEKTGTDGSSISRIAAGKANPSTPLLILLAQLLDCQVEDFLSNQDEIVMK